MKDVDRRLAAISERQYGVVSRSQARAAGLSASSLSYRISRGDLIPCGQTALRLPGAAPCWRGLLAVGMLDLGPRALVAGRAAARLLGLDGFDSEAIEFLVPRSLRNRATVGRVTSSSDINRIDRVVIDGLPCTSATRTIIDLLATASPDEIGNALDSACRKRLTAVPVVERRLAELGRQGRPGVATFDRLVRAGVVESWLERQFLKVVRDARLPEPVPQRRHRLVGVGVVRVDFEYPLWSIVVEVGGQRGYLSLDERRHKERRRNELQLDGKTIYFFTRNDVVENPEYVVRTLATALRVGLPSADERAAG